MLHCEIPSFIWEVSSFFFVVQKITPGGARTVRLRREGRTQDAPCRGLLVSRIKGIHTGGGATSRKGGGGTGSFRVLGESRLWTMRITVDFSPVGIFEKGLKSLPVFSKSSSFGGPPRWGPCCRRGETCAGCKGYNPLCTDPLSEVVWSDGARGGAHCVLRGISRRTLHSWFAPGLPPAESAGEVSAGPVRG